MSSFADQIIAEGNVEKVEAMQAEIERLRAAAEEDYNHGRRDAIEECAQAVLNVPQNGSEYIEPEVYAAAIRALKDK